MDLRLLIRGAGMSGAIAAAFLLGACQPKLLHGTDWQYKLVDNNADASPYPHAGKLYTWDQGVFDVEVQCENIGAGASSDFMVMFDIIARDTKGQSLKITDPRNGYDVDMVYRGGKIQKAIAIVSGPDRISVSRESKYSFSDIRIPTAIGLKLPNGQNVQLAVDRSSAGFHTFLDKCASYRNPDLSVVPR